MTELEKFEAFKSAGYRYDAVTGLMYNTRNEEAGSITNKGYIRCDTTINSIRIGVQAHRLAWYLHYGILPSEKIDHDNRVRCDNRIDNLRDITMHKNSFNRDAKGYHKTKNGRFRATIMLNRKSISLGTYDTEKEAHQAYLDAKKIYHII